MDTVTNMACAPLHLGPRGRGERWYIHVMKNMDESAVDYVIIGQNRSSRMTNDDIVHHDERKKKK